MKIILVGYGKMGKTIEKISLERGHSIAGIVSLEHESLQNIDPDQMDLAIEFTQPDAALSNILTLIEKGIPVISGTTGWLKHWKEVEAAVRRHDGTFFYASNYSVGVNLFFQLNKYLARLMKAQPEYKIQMEEIHHTQKKDAPSGTAITLAEGILEQGVAYADWALEDQEKENAIPIRAIRKDEVPGTHTIQYQSELDEISISHKAHSRQGFALGAVLVAEWIHQHQIKGMKGMEDFLPFFD